MKSFNVVAAQGEITMRRISDGTKAIGKPLTLEGGHFIIGHSETGHHHVLEHSRGVEVTILERPPVGMRILHAVLTEANTLVHKRGHDTHEAIRLEPGTYDIRIAREFDHYEELARKSAD